MAGCETKDRRFQEKVSGMRGYIFQKKTFNNFILITVNVILVVTCAWVNALFFLFLNSVNSRDILKNYVHYNVQAGRCN